MSRRNTTPTSFERIKDLQTMACIYRKVLEKGKRKSTKLIKCKPQAQKQLEHRKGSNLQRQLKDFQKGWKRHLVSVKAKDRSEFHMLVEAGILTQQKAKVIEIPASTEQKRRWNRLLAEMRSVSSSEEAEEKEAKPQLRRKGTAKRRKGRSTHVSYQLTALFPDIARAKCISIEEASKSAHKEFDSCISRIFLDKQRTTNVSFQKKHELSSEREPRRTFQELLRKKASPSPVKHERVKSYFQKAKQKANQVLQRLYKKKSSARYQFNLRTLKEYRNRLGF